MDDQMNQANQDENQVHEDGSMDMDHGQDEDQINQDMDHEDVYQNNHYNKCFICYDEFLTRNPPGEISKLPPPKSKLYSRTITKLLTKNKSNIQISFETTHYCSKCLTEIEQVQIVLEQLEKLNQDLDCSRNKLIKQIDDTYRRLEYVNELDHEFDQRLRRVVLSYTRSQDEIGNQAAPQIKSQFEKEINSAKKSIQSMSIPYVKLVPLDESTLKNYSFEDVEIQNIKTEVLEEMENTYSEDDWSEPEPVQTDLKKKKRGFALLQARLKRKRHNWSSGKKLRKSNKCRTSQTVNTGVAAVSFNSSSPSTSRKSHQVKNEHIPTLTEVFVCPNCDSVYANFSDLASHEINCHKTVLTVHYATCKICHGTFLQSQLDRHTKTAHNNTPKITTDPPKRGTCIECPGKLFRDIKRHRLTTHETSLTCEICGATYDKYIDYNYHRTTHDELNLDPVKCQQCGKIFSANQYLRGHIKLVHLKQFELTCEKCGVGKRNPYELNQHIKSVHESSRDHACTICDSKFTTDHYLKQHILRHQGIRGDKYVCKDCSKAFPNITKLKDHEVAVHGDGQFKHVCDVCGKAFAVYNYLYIHLRSHETKEEKDARRLKAKLKAEARKLSEKPVLVAKGRPRTRPVKDQKISSSGYISDINNSAEGQAKLELEPSQQLQAAFLTNNSTQVPESNCTELPISFQTPMFSIQNSVNDCFYGIDGSKI